jgi:hypothetical protein
MGQDKYTSEPRRIFCTGLEETHQASVEPYWKWGVTQFQDGICQCMMRIYLRGEYILPENKMKIRGAMDSKKCKKSSIVIRSRNMTTS